MSDNSNKSHKNAQSQSTEDKILQAGFALLEEKRWREITLDDIALEANLEKADVLYYMKDRSDLLDLYNKKLDARIAQNIGAADEEIPVKDRLFDVLMERFELMNEDREALSSIIKSFDPDITHILSNFIRLHQSIDFMLDLAGLKTKGLMGPVRHKGLKIIYLLALRKWLEDESEDLTDTMTALDQYLKRADQFAQSFMPGS